MDATCSDSDCDRDATHWASDGSRLCAEHYTAWQRQDLADLNATPPPEITAP